GSHVLRNKLRGSIPARCRNCRQNSAGDEARRYPGRAADQVRTRHQPHHRQRARTENSRSVVAARRRVDRMSEEVKRREFISLLGGAAAAWPLAARSQQGERVRRIGLLLPASSDDPVFQAWVGAFLQGLALSGWTLGRNMRLDTRWAMTAADIRRHAAELVALAPHVILAHGAVTVGPLLQVTRTVPIVFPVAGDPVAAGFVESMARPGGNATGFIAFEYSISGKWLELLKEIAPGVTR